MVKYKIGFKCPIIKTEGTPRFSGVIFIVEQFFYNIINSTINKIPLKFKIYFVSN